MNGSASGSEGLVPWIAALRRAAHHPVSLLAVAAALALVPYGTQSTYWLRIANNVALLFILTLGLEFILGRAGQLSFAQAGFFAVGSYTSSLLALDAGVPVVVAVPLAGVAAVVASVVIGWPTLRLKAHYFALATFGFSEIVRLVATNWKSVTRGMDGVTQIPPIAIGTFVIDTDARYYVLLLGVATLLVGGYRRLVGSKFGRVFAAVRQGELPAQLVGVNVATVKMFAFALSAFCAGLAGAFYAHLFGVISPDLFAFETLSIPVLVSLFVGGSGSALGLLAGATVVASLPEVLRGLGRWYMTFYGLAIVLWMICMPDGIAGRVRRLLAQRSPAMSRGAAVSVDHGHRAPGPGINGGAGPLLRVEGLTKTFGGVVAVEDLSFEVTPAQIKSLIGPNGAGKTTALNLITGVYRPDAGAVYMGKTLLVGQPPHVIARAGVLRTFQNIRVWNDLSVIENVMVSLHGRARVGAAGVLVGSRAARAEERAMRERAESALELVGLGELRDATAASLAYGHRRLLEVARCIVAAPRLILLDEPAAGLNRQEALALLNRLDMIRHNGTAILLVEHNMDFVMAVSDSVVVMTHGRRIAEGTPREVRSDPLVVEAYLGAEMALA